MVDKNMLIPLARDFSLKAHAGRVSTTVGGLKRAQTIHLQEVADLVWASGGTDGEISAAWLHDTIEDTQTTLADIVNFFGPDIARMVEGLTDPDDFAAMPTSERKARQAERVRGEGESVRRIKIADQISNVRLLALDPSVTMMSVGCADYIEGAKLIAEACRGISPLLDGLFAEAYKRGVLRYASEGAVGAAK
jgi:guanosine-3',5'-bis(diphosphate) 3'-pyrophosphohydrolase